MILFSSSQTETHPQFNTYFLNLKNAFQKILKPPQHKVKDERKLKIYLIWLK